MLEIYDAIQEMKKIDARKALANEVLNFIAKNDFTIINGRICIDEELYLEVKDITEAIQEALKK